MDEPNEKDVDLNNEEDQDDEDIEEVKESAKEEKPKRTPEEQLAYLEGRTQRLRKKLGLVEPRKKAEKTNELDNADYALLTAKGYEEEEDVEFIHDKMIKWNKPLREILKDEDVLAKLKGMKIERDVKKAMPGNTKRSGSGALDNVEYWKAKYDQTGELPDDFELRSAVINAKIQQTTSNKPSWR